MVTMCFGLVACGSGDTDKDLSSDATTEEVSEVLAETTTEEVSEVLAETTTIEETEAPKDEGVSIGFGDKIEHNGLSLSFDSMEFADENILVDEGSITYTIGIDEGYKWLLIKGQASNDGTEEISTHNIIFSALINDSIKLEDNTDLYFMQSDRYSIDPYHEIGYVIGVKMPEKLVDEFEKVSIDILFNDGFSYPSASYVDDKDELVFEADHHYIFTASMNDESDD